jgi:hypothetical protein
MKKVPGMPSSGYSTTINYPSAATTAATGITLENVGVNPANTNTGGLTYGPGYIQYPPGYSPGYPASPYPATCYTCGKTPPHGVVHVEVSIDAGATLPLGSHLFYTFCDKECLREEIAPWRVEEDGTPGKIYHNLREILELE